MLLHGKDNSGCDSAITMNIIARSVIMTAMVINFFDVLIHSPPLLACPLTGSHLRPRYKQIGVVILNGENGCFNSFKISVSINGYCVGKGRIPYITGCDTGLSVTCYFYINPLIFISCPYKLGAVPVLFV